MNILFDRVRFVQQSTYTKKISKCVYVQIEVVLLEYVYIQNVIRKIQFLFNTFKLYFVYQSSVIFRDFFFRVDYIITYINKIYIIKMISSILDLKLR